MPLVSFLDWNEFCPKIVSFYKCFLFVLLVSCQLVLVALMFLLVLLDLLILFFLIRGSCEKI